MGGPYKRITGPHVAMVPGSRLFPRGSAAEGLLKSVRSVAGKAFTTVCVVRKAYPRTE